MSDLEKGKAGNSYTAENITVLEGLEAVRKRPAMYIGDVNIRGLHHLVYEVVDNSIDEALAGYCDAIDVIIHENNSVTVIDNGRGIPTDYHEKEKRSALEVVMTVLHAGGKFDKDTYKVSGGLHGVGVSVVNALSSHLKVIVRKDGKMYEQEYEFGKPLYPIKTMGDTDKKGTEITFLPDNSIFITDHYDFEILTSRLRELAFLNKGITLTIVDEREKDENGIPLKESFYSDNGLKDFIDFLDSNREKLMPEPISIEGEKNGIPIEVAMQYNTSFTENIHSYVNNINTHEGGTHLAGFRRALTRTLKSYADKTGLLSKLKFDISGDDLGKVLQPLFPLKCRSLSSKDRQRQNSGIMKSWGLSIKPLASFSPTILKNTQRKPEQSLIKSFLLQQPGMQRVKLASWFNEKVCWADPAFRENLPTVPKKILPYARYTWLKVIAQVVRQNREGKENIRRSFHSAVKFSMWKKPCNIKSSKAKRSRIFSLLLESALELLKTVKH